MQPPAGRRAKEIRPCAKHYLEEDYPVRRTMPDEQNLLLEEYKLIQAKIDKLGEDKFKVRSWCFTIVAGVLAGAKLSGALNDAWNATFLLFVFFPVIGAFQLIEQRQRQIANRFGVRAQQIELNWIRNLSRVGQGRPATVRLAGFLIAEGKAERERCSLWKWLIRHFVTPKSRKAVASSREKPRKPKAAQEPASLKECLTSRADFLFYITQYFVVAVSIVFLVGNRFYGAVTPQKTNDESSLILKINTNEFRLAIAQTNLHVTNFIQVIQKTTNFIPIAQFTTNFVITNSVVTNSDQSNRTK
jgi:hypothetical protein